MVAFDVSLSRLIVFHVSVDRQGSEDCQHRLGGVRRQVGADFGRDGVDEVQAALAQLRRADQQPLRQLLDRQETGQNVCEVESAER